ncbi:helix-turn-helix domain-containing protein [Streptomyces sp. NPDC006259]|uniref:helix-turn-helix domain-containing protein n=1 Tax=Streptomyces sp. NPDC006259 TaxID=3364740 RepID=UPI0036C535EF
MTRIPADGTPQRPFADLAQHLTALRRAARLPQRALAEAASVSRGAVQRAESGTAAPTPAVLDAYLRACRAGEADRARARLLRTRGRTVQRDRLRALKAAAPAFAHTERELGLVLAEVYERAGAPSLSDARLTPERTPLPRTTAWRIVNRKGLPASVEQLITFLTACGISRPAAQRPYLDAYRHVIAQRGTRPVPPHAQRTQRTQRTQLIRRIHPAPLAQGGADTGARYELTGQAAVLAQRVPPRTFEEAVTTDLFQSAGREAHRNGTAVPDWITVTSLMDHEVDFAPDGGVFIADANDQGVDLIVRTDHGTAAYQFKSFRGRPGPPPALPGARVPTPPPRPAPTARAS